MSIADYLSRSTSTNENIITTTYRIQIWEDNKKVQNRSNGYKVLKVIIVRSGTENGVLMTSLS